MISIFEVKDGDPISRESYVVPGTCARVEFSPGFGGHSFRISVNGMWKQDLTDKARAHFQREKTTADKAHRIGAWIQAELAPAISAAIDRQALIEYLKNESAIEGNHGHQQRAASLAEIADGLKRGTIGQAPKPEALDSIKLALWASKQASRHELHAGNPISQIPQYHVSQIQEARCAGRAEAFREVVGAISSGDFDK